MIFFMKVNNKLVTKGSKYHKFSHLFWLAMCWCVRLEKNNILFNENNILFNEKSTVLNEIFGYELIMDLDSRL
jgi:hypothetical protein